MSRAAMVPVDTTDSASRCRSRRAPKVVPRNRKGSKSMALMRSVTTNHVPTATISHRKVVGRVTRSIASSP